MDVKDYIGKEKYTFDDLTGIITVLRSENGCPWDRAQTHTSIRKNLIEETYEVCEAIDTDDTALMREELGDLLMQVMLHSEIAKEEKRFDIDDVIDEVSRKLVVRHPHVFADVDADTPEKALLSWEAVKALTKKDKRKSSLDGIPPSLPALMRASKLINKAKKAGMGYDASAVSEGIASDAASLASVYDADTASKLLLDIVSLMQNNEDDAEECLTRRINELENKLRIKENDKKTIDANYSGIFDEENPKNIEK